MIRTVFTRLSAAALIFSQPADHEGGGVYSRAALIQGRRLNIGKNTYKVTINYAEFQVIPLYFSTLHNEVYISEECSCMMRT